MPQLAAAAIYSLQYMYITERIPIFQFPAHNTSPRRAKAKAEAKVGNANGEAKLRYSSGSGCNTLDHIYPSNLSLSLCMSVFPYLPVRGLSVSLPIGTRVTWFVSLRLLRRLIYELCIIQMMHCLSKLQLCLCKHVCVVCLQSRCDLKSQAVSECSSTWKWFNYTAALSLNCSQFKHLLETINVIHVKYICKQ